MTPGTRHLREGGGGGPGGGGCGGGGGGVVVAVVEAAAAVVVEPAAAAVAEAVADGGGGGGAGGGGGGGGGGAGGGGGGGPVTTTKEPLMLRMRIAVIGRCSGREVHEPRLASGLGDARGAVRRRYALHRFSLEVEVVNGRRVVDLHRVHADRERAAVQVVPLGVAKGDFLARLVVDGADQRPAAWRADVRRRRRIRRNQAIHHAEAGAGVHASTCVFAEGERGEHVLPRVRIALRIGDLELDVPDGIAAVVAVDVAAEDLRQRRVADHVAPRDRAARVLPSRMWVLPDGLCEDRQAAARDTADRD